MTDQDYMKPIRDAALNLAHRLTPEETHSPDERRAACGELVELAGAILDAVRVEAANAMYAKNIEALKRESKAWGEGAMSEALADHEWCRRCHGPNVVWSAPSPLWNKVMRGDDINGDPLFSDLVCMPCFVALAAEAGLPTGRWRLTMNPEPDGLTYTTPSGRTWDDERWLWVETR